MHNDPAIFRNFEVVTYPLLRLSQCYTNNMITMALSTHPVTWITTAKGFYFSLTPRCATSVLLVCLLSHTLPYTMYIFLGILWGLH